MNSLNANTLLGNDLLSRSGEILTARFSCGKVVIITDEHVEKLYVEIVSDSLTRANFHVSKFILPAGENAKTLANYCKIIEFLSTQKLNKADLVLALGGGVVGDLAGFAAATFLRGMKLVQMPTTLLAMVDSAIGGKTAVNLPTGKNLLGTFYQPHYFIADTSVLKTLPEKYFADGVAEIIKYAIIGDAGLFAQLSANKLRENLSSIIARCIQHKQKIVALDKHDEGIRQLLNFGHTLGHAIEKCSAYQITHGHAVAMGMAEITKRAVQMNFCAPEIYPQILHVLKLYDLPTTSPFTIAELTNAIGNDKKRRGEKITLVLPKKIGECVLHQVEFTTLDSQ